MKLTQRTSVFALAVAALGLGMLSLQSASTAAQDPSTADVGSFLRRNISTQVVTLTGESARGEPRDISAKVQFDRNVETYWVSVVGADIKFTRSTEKQINRQLFSVDPLAKVNGRTVEVTGKLGIRDGSGDWDDSYEGTITVAVTAVLAN